MKYNHTHEEHIKFSVQIRNEFLSEKSASACGLQQFCITWIYLVQNGAVYEGFHKLAMIHGRVINSYSPDWLADEHMGQSSTRPSIG